MNICIGYFDAHSYKNIDCIYQTIIYCFDNKSRAPVNILVFVNCIKTYAVQRTISSQLQHKIILINAFLATS